ncbi:MAG TPA: 3-oxoacyl-ACP reductase family protein [Deferrisomatales bacterium]|nr:3-oxoacyl-ACP reductase family protein [Deferrisomatales bacterium]
MRLTDKVAIVTGGSRGIGKEIGLRCAQEGARVVLADVLDASGAAREIQAAGGEALALRTDVSDEASTREMAARAVERFARIDILVNNAAIFADLGKKKFTDISSEEWDQVLAVNLKGAFLCAKAVYPQMRAQQNGKIINISSATFFAGVPFFLHYVATKGAVVALTRALAREVGDDGINVNAIAPGLTLSEAVQDNPMYPADYLRKAAGGRCFRRDQLPGDLTGAILFLASSDSDFVTGQTLVVDGGGVMH